MNAFSRNIVSLFNSVVLVIELLALLIGQELLPVGAR